MPDENGDSFVRITNREVYERLGKVEAKLDDSLRTNAQLMQRLEEHHKRLRSLELRFYGILAGLLGAVVVLARVGIGG